MTTSSSSNNNPWAYHPSDGSFNRHGNPPRRTLRTTPDIYKNEQHGNDEVIPQANHQRRRLKLEPRGSSQTVAPIGRRSPTSKSNPFGAAKPREEVLAGRGIDVRLADERIQKKASNVHFNQKQETWLETVRAELTVAEENLREANENEMPEEVFRVIVEQKRKELNNLLEKFKEANAREPNGVGGKDTLHEASSFKSGLRDASPKNSRKGFERPSERRRRLEQGKSTFHNRTEGWD